MAGYIVFWFTNLQQAVSHQTHQKFASFPLYDPCSMFSFLDRREIKRSYVWLIVTDNLELKILQCTFCSILHHICHVFL